VRKKEGEKKKKKKKKKRRERGKTKRARSANRARELAIDYAAISDFRRRSARFIQIIAFSILAHTPIIRIRYVCLCAHKVRLTIAIALRAAIVIATPEIQRHVIAWKSRRYRTTTPCSRITWAILDNERPNTNWTSTTRWSTSDATNWPLSSSAASSCRNAGLAAASYVPAAVSASVSRDNLFSLKSPHSARSSLC